MRLSSLAVVTAALVIAAVLCVSAASAIVRVVEDVSRQGVQEALIDGGHEWASVQSDGLQVVIEGEAPSESARFRAMSAAGTVVDTSRVIDNIRIRATEDLAAPTFGIEVLRNDRGLTLIGLIPAATNRDSLSARIADIADGQPVADFLEAADHPRPEGWQEALTYGLRAIGRLPRSKVSIAAGRLTIDAIAESEAEKSRLETELRRTLPEGLTLTLDITAPRPVITPFTVRLTKDEAGTRFDACAAANEEQRDAIVDAAVAAGAEGRVSCTLALGSPSPRWGEAVARAISALDRLGGGTLTFSDADVRLVAAEGTDPTLFDTVVGELDNALPPVFALDAILLEPPEPGEAVAPEFSATLSPEGQVQIRGRVSDDLINTMISNLARARFGEGVVMGTRVAEGLPQGWSVKVLAALEALAELENGSVLVQPDLVTIRGNTGDRDASAEISRLMVEKLGPDAAFELAVVYEESLDPVVGLPTPEECLGRIGIVTRDRKITFDPGSATLTADTQPVVDDIAEILRQCMDLPIEVAGYTDSQGSEDGNLRLSQSRAEAVLSALRARRVPVSSFEAVGYGEADPIADNGTAEGREANRRIEFRLVSPEEPGEDGAEAEDTASGEETTDEAE